MTSYHDHDDSALARDEAWLRDRMEEVPQPDLRRIKRGIHVALNERWLAGDLGEFDTAPLRTRLKAAIRGALNEPPACRATHGNAESSALSVRNLTLWGTGLSAAAACLMLLLGRNAADFRPRFPSALDAFVAYESDGMMAELAALRRSVVDFTSADDEASDDVTTRELMELKESIDRIFGTNHEADDWS
jgi:hypothetical protein